jgi:uncharacterized C2H2 Zn-finger protein
MLENLAFHEYNECWIYYSFMQEETDPKVKSLYELHLAMEIEHLRIACELIRKIERRDPEEFLPKAIERTMQFKENKEYVRQVLTNQVELTSKGTEFVPIMSVPEDDRYFAYNSTVNGGWVPSEVVIAKTIEGRGQEYRLETEGPNPVPGLRRAEDRKKSSTEYAKRVAAE